MSSDKRGLEHKSGKRGSFLMDAGAVILGAAIGARLFNDLIGGRGLPVALAQLGGALLGAAGGKAMADAFQEQKHEDRPQ